MDKEVVKYNTATLYNTAQPQFNELISLQNVPVGTTFEFEVFDKDYILENDAVGKCSWTLDAATAAAAPPADGAANGHTNGVAANGAVAGPNTQTLRLPLEPAPGVRAADSRLVIQVKCRQVPKDRADPAQPLLHMGPVRFRTSVSKLAGALTGQVAEDGWMAFAAYKLQLAAVSSFFNLPAELKDWNKDYAAAQTIFQNIAVRKTVETQHQLLYRDKGEQHGTRSRGLLSSGAELLALLECGVRGGERRYFTYAIVADGSMRFSETGAAFFSDFMSKHAMHAGVAEQVVYAGEFCFVTAAEGDALDKGGPIPAAPAAYKGKPDPHPSKWHLVIDNNSGTYAPPGARLPKLKQLLAHNFPGLTVHTLDAMSSKQQLDKLHSAAPSRKPASATGK